MTDSVTARGEANLLAFSNAHEHEERRRWTRIRNAELGCKRPAPYKPEFMPPEDMLDRCFYVDARDEIVIIPPSWANDHGMTLMSLPPKHFKQMQNGNWVDHPTRVNRQGEAVQVNAADLWLSDPNRKCVREAMYAIGRDRFVITPNGDLAVNLWSPTKRLKTEADISLFHQHVAFLLPNWEDRERFLDWLAHCEQKPQELPHHGWLMWTEQFGIGRNWLASVLARVWQGEVAPSLDLVALLGGSFNNALSCKRCAVVDEIHIGSNNSLFAMAARLRQIMTEEIRMINPKYGKMTAEFNTTRWLIFSNHDDALPIPEDDRRFEVVKNPSEVQHQDYYSALYKALDDPEFISGVCYFLAKRDITKYNAGARPRMTEAKTHIIQASTPQIERDAQQTIAAWKAAGIKMFCSIDLIKDVGATQQQTAAFHHILKRLKVVPMGKMKIGRLPERVFAIDKQSFEDLAAETAVSDGAARILLERGEGGLFYREEAF